MNWEFGFLYFLQQLHNPVLDSIMVFISTTGDSGMIWIVIGLLLLCFKRTRLMGVAVLITMLLGLLIGNVALKNIIARPRPCWIDRTVPLLLENPDDFSFPSGHTLAAFGAAASIFLYRRNWGIGALIYASLIAFSRMYLFVHFPTDVAAAMALGICLAIVVKKFFSKHKVYGMI